MRELRTRSWLSLHTRKAVRRGHPHQHGGKHVQEIRHSYTYQVGRESLPRWGTRLQRCGTSHGDQGVGRHSSHSPDNAADVLRGPRRKAGSPTTDRRVRRRGFRHGGGASATTAYSENRYLEPRLQNYSVVEYLGDSRRREADARVRSSVHQGAPCI